MDFQGDFRTRSSREATWRFVMDPQQMGPCGPGVKDIEVVDDTHYRIIARVGIGAIGMTFRVDAELTEVQEPDRASVRITAQAPGTAVEGLAHMVLSDDDGGTRMDWDVHVDINGRLASVGERLIRGTADKLVQQTFDCVRTKLG